MLTKSFLFLFVFFLNVFLFGISPEIVLGQKNDNQNKIIRFVNRHDDDGALTRPRVFADPPKKTLIDKTSIVTAESKAAVTDGFERQVFALINQKRMESGLNSLIWNDDLAKIARMHSKSMADRKFFDHTGLDGKMVNNRADAIGLSKWRSIGENIAYNRGYAAPLEFAVEGWMKSPAHRDNILNNRWQESGIGIAVTDDGTYYFTQVFLLRK